MDWTWIDELAMSPNDRLSLMSWVRLERDEFDIRGFIVHDS